MATAKSCLKSHPKPPEDLNYADDEFDAFLTLATKTEPVSFEEEEEEEVDKKKQVRYQSLPESGSPSPANYTSIRLQSKPDGESEKETSQHFHQHFDENTNSEEPVIAKEDLEDSDSGSDSNPDSDSENSQDPDRKLQKGKFKKFIPEDRKWNNQNCSCRTLLCPEMTSYSGRPRATSPLQPGRRKSKRIPKGLGSDEDLYPVYPPSNYPTAKQRAESDPDRHVVFRKALTRSKSRVAEATRHRKSESGQLRSHGANIQPQKAPASDSNAEFDGSDIYMQPATSQLDAVAQQFLPPTITELTELDTWLNPGYKLDGNTLGIFSDMINQLSITTKRPVFVIPWYQVLHAFIGPLNMDVRQVDSDKWRATLRKDWAEKLVRTLYCYPTIWNANPHLIYRPSYLTRKVKLATLWRSLLVYMTMAMVQQ